MGEDLCVGAGAGLDDFAGEEVGVDEGEGVSGGGEEAGDGGFAGGDAAGQAEEKHFEGLGGRWSWGGGELVGIGDSGCGW